jgi:hypothetical protein
MWKPATIEEVMVHVRNDLGICDSRQLETFRQYAVEPYAAPITRYGHHENVFVVARKDDEAIYWEDVEEGFNVSPIDGNGAIVEHWCNQDRLGNALNYWITGRASPRIGPARV